MSPENVLRAFEKNHRALLDLVAQETFDINELNRLVEVRTHIVDEIVKAGLDQSTLQHVTKRHEQLEHAILSARNQNDGRLNTLHEGRRALKAYRG